LRGDVRALKSHNTKLAGKEKTKIEEAERVKRKEREAQAVQWSPVYFKKITNDDTTNGATLTTSWEFMGKSYWEDRKQRKAQFKQKLSDLRKSKQGADPIHITKEQDKVEEISPRSP